MSFSAEQVITALYRGILNRNPDREGAKIFTDMLVSDPTLLNDVAMTLHDSDERRTLNSASKHIADHSQFGEFPILLRLLLQTKKSKRIVVDVGARGRERSNSYDLLANFGWKGFLVEANPRLHDSICTDFAGTDFKLIGVAAGLTEESLPFYIGVNDDVSSLLRVHAATWGEVRDVVDVPVRRLPTILDDLGIPERFDVLSLDIEGMDVAVLNDLIENSHYRPDHVIIEASYSFSTKALADVHAAQAVQDLYEIAGQTEANLLLRLRDLVEDCENSGRARQGSLASSGRGVERISGEIAALLNGQTEINESIAHIREELKHRERPETDARPEPSQMTRQARNVYARLLRSTANADASCE